MLTDKAISNLKAGPKPYRVADSGGLYIEVRSDGAKYWRTAYRFASKQKTLALGVYPAVGLKEARRRRDDAKELLEQGIDPGQKKKTDKLIAASAAANNFKAVATAWHQKVSPNLTPEYSAKVLRSLEVDVFPALGHRPVGDIRPTEVLATLRKIEARGALETLKRVRQRMSDVFTYAITSGLREAENPVTGLEKALKTRKAAHYPSLHVRQMPTFFIRLEAARISLPVKLAIRLATLLFLRPGELRAAHWSEIDLDSATWIVPGERDRARGMTGMKMRDAHVVPLSRQAVEIFRQLLPYSGHGELVFPNRNDPKRAMSDNTINSALRAMGYAGNEVSGHGFRATAASALSEMGFRKEVIDRQLAHKERNQVLAAYVHQAEYIEERRTMMQAWADHLSALESGANVVPINTKAA
ncbi:MAG: DUF4102 domain-containing protein [Betaproteobacteria bacterium]|nr:DUF4102 domain-containing protein [Betaproteobacteria bacterium]